MRGEGRLDEPHRPDAFTGARMVVGLAVANSGAELVVDVRERLDEALMVSRRNARAARGGFGRLAHVRRLALVDALGLEGGLHRQVVRRLLVPEELVSAVREAGSRGLLDIFEYDALKKEFPA